MNAERALLVSLLIVSAGAAAFGWQKARTLTAQNRVLTEDLAKLRIEQGSNSIERAKIITEETRRKAAEDELVRLRNQANALRARAATADKLATENQQLRMRMQTNQSLTTTIPGAPNPQASRMTNAPGALGDQFPKEAWTFAGYGSPESALISAIWSMREGNPVTYLESLSPEEQVRMAKSWENKSESEISTKHQQDVAAITGLKVLAREAVSDHEMVMQVQIDGVNRTEKVSMKKVGDEWKFGGFARER